MYSAGVNFGTFKLSPVYLTNLVVGEHLSALGYDVSDIPDCPCRHLALGRRWG